MMEGGSGAPTGAVFLSYASEDTEAAQRICEALRSAGIEVWFDKSELRGGDAWDRSIRQQIHDCALFVPIISQHTHERLEGYFRLEWKLAVDRTHTMAEVKAFLVPVVIDGTTEQDPTIPEKFRELQWTRLPGGETPPAFVGRVKRLLSGETPAPTRAHSSPGALQAPARSRRLLAIAAVLAALGAAAYLGIEKPWVSKPAAFAPPPHSVAVLPFVNMSGDKEQEYFSDGLTDELLNSLAQVNGLHVAGRTSAFSFKGKDTDLGTVAHQLNVGAILEGSVRRSGNTIRISTELVNAVTGFQLWSKSYDRDLGDVLKLQTEIATAVASALKVTLLGDVAAKIGAGGTHDPAAFDAYLRGSKEFGWEQHGEDIQAAISDFTEAIHRDPNFALAFSRRSLALARYARIYADGRTVGEYLDKARADARKAIALAPDVAEGHVALARFLAEALEFVPASQEYEHALALAPGNSEVLSLYGMFAVLMGRTELGLAAIRRSVQLDPLNSGTHLSLGYALNVAGLYRESIAALRDAKTLNPNDGHVNAFLGFSYFYLGDYRNALAACDRADDGNKPICLATVYAKIGRRVDAEATLAKLRTAGDDGSVGLTYVYVAWGDVARALDSLEMAMRHRDPDLVYVKADRGFDPLRKEPRFQAIVRALKFPD
jgi:TolB-like protein